MTRRQAVVYTLYPLFPTPTFTFTLLCGWMQVSAYVCMVANSPLPSQMTLLAPYIHVACHTYLILPPPSPFEYLLTPNLTPLPTSLLKFIKSHAKSQHNVKHAFLFLLFLSPHFSLSLILYPTLWHPLLPTRPHLTSLLPSTMLSWKEVTESMCSVLAACTCVASPHASAQGSQSVVSCSECSTSFPTHPSM